MPIIQRNRPNYKKRKDVVAEWDTVRKGLNLLLRPTELGRDEMAQADNIMITGKGIPTGRWGTEVFFTANATGSIRGMGTYISTDGSTNEFLALTDQGYLVKKNGLNSTQINGQSWPSGTIIRTEQLGDKTYIVSEDVSFTSYDGTSIEVFATISPPTGLAATNWSGVSGTNEVSWKVLQVGANGGQTTASNNYVLSNLPTDLSLTTVHLLWTAASAATYRGFEIYRGNPGDETFIASIGAGVTTYVDTGIEASQIITPPVTNTTGGVKSKFLVKFKDRFIAVDKDDPNKLLISGRYPNHTRFNWADGGGFIYIDPDSGDNITGIGVQPIADRLVVYKNYSSYVVDLQIITIGNYAVLDPQYSAISTSVGCSNQSTIATVENDTFYFGRDGLYVTGYEPNFLNIIRTNEVSAKIRPYINELTETDYTTACAFYIDNKYLLSFPNRKEIIVYDRERSAFTGPWKFPFGLSHLENYVDGSGIRHWVLGSYEDNKIYEFDENLNTDNGTAIIKKIRLNKDYLDDWSALSIIKFFYVMFRSVIGQVTVNIIVEDRNGNSFTAKTFTINGSETSGSTGWGMDTWGTVTWGLTNTNFAVTSTNEITKWGSLFKQARLVQIEIVSTQANANFELLQIQLTASKQSSGNLSASQRV